MEGNFIIFQNLVGYVLPVYLTSYICLRCITCVIMIVVIYTKVS